MSIEQIYEQHVKPLEPPEQLRLVEKIVHDLAGNGAASLQTRPGRDWRELRGISPNLLEGEDAQAWVSRGRRERDDQLGLIAGDSE